MLHVTFYVLHFVHHLLLQWFIASKLAWVVRSFRLLFSSYLHLTLTVFHQLIIPLRYLTIKIRNQSLFPLLCIVRAVSPRSISSSIPNLVVSSIIIICLRQYFGCSGFIMIWFGWFLRWLFFTFPTFCSRRMPMIAPILHPRLIHSSIDIYFTLFHRACWRSTFIIDLQIVSSIVGV